MHLKIIQSTSQIEFILQSSLDKLYWLARNNNLDGTSEICGNVKVDSIYPDVKDYLNANFPNLIIAYDNLFIRFEDSEVESVLRANNILPATVGITTSAALSKIIPQNCFKNNTTVQYFDEIKYFSPTLPASVFSGCTSLISVDLRSVTLFTGTSTFYNCTNLQWFQGYNNGDIGVLNMPLLQTLRNTDFNNCTNLKEIQSLGSVTTIPDSCFKGCTSLEEVTLPQSCTTIEAEAFSGCTRLETINLNNVTYVGTNAFNNTAWYSNLPDGNVIIGLCLYKVKGSVNTITIPEGVVYINRNCVDNNTTTTSLSIPSTVTSIEVGNYNYQGLAFGKMTALTSITVDANNTKYNSNNNCNAIIETATGKLIRGCSSTLIPNNVTQIATHAFRGTTFTLDYVVSDNLLNVGEGAYSDCTFLKLTIQCGQNETPTLGSQSFGNISANEIVIENGRTYIPYGFGGDTVSVYLPPSLSTVLSNNKPNLDNNFFYNANVSYVYCYATTPPKCGTSNSPGFGLSNLIAIYVPEDSVNAYKTADRWSKFASKIQAMPSDKVNFYNSNNSV